MPAGLTAALAAEPAGDVAVLEVDEPPLPGPGLARRNPLRRPARCAWASVEGDHGPW
jgi:hypothetical protein